MFNCLGRGRIVLGAEFRELVLFVFLLGKATS